MSKFTQQAGLSNRYSLHSLRHTAALLRYRAGEKIHSIQRLLGHRSLATTDIYLQGLAGIDDPGAQLLIERFGGF